MESTGELVRTLIIDLLVLWALGILSAYTAVGFIHVLLVVALILLLTNFIPGRGAAV